jgi:hypothetical protein
MISLTPLVTLLQPKPEGFSSLWFRQVAGAAEFAQASAEALPLPADTPPEKAVADFLDVFGATMERGAVFVDASGAPVSITRALFIKGRNKATGDFKWAEQAEKTERLRYINLLAMTLAEPDEIWWTWEASRDDPGRWLLKRRYLKSFEMDTPDGKQYGIGAFEWGRDGWSGSTAFMAQMSGEKRREKYFDKQRKGRLVYKK